MSFMLKVARSIKLTAAGRPDLERELYKSAGDFASAINLWAERFASDLKHCAQYLDGMRVSAKVVSLDAVRLRREFAAELESVRHFATRTDLILARRCLQYAEIADQYLKPMGMEDRRRAMREAQQYLAKLDASIALITKVAAKWDTFGRSKGLDVVDKPLFDYLAELRKLSLEKLIEMLKAGNVPFRLS